MFDRNERPLKREYETLGWLDLPELGRQQKSNGKRAIRAVIVASTVGIVSVLLGIVVTG